MRFYGRAEEKRGGEGGEGESAGLSALVPRRARHARAGLASRPVLYPLLERGGKERGAGTHPRRVQGAGEGKILA